MARFFFIASAILAASASAVQAQPSSTPTDAAAAQRAPETGKTREQVLQELIAARKAGEVWRGNAEPAAFKSPAARRPPVGATAAASDAPQQDR